MTSRRAFLRGLFAAPAIVAASSLMPISSRLLLDMPPKLWGDGVHDDGPAIRAMIAEIEKKGGGVLNVPPGNYFLGRTVHVPAKVMLVGNEQRPKFIGRPHQAVFSAAPGAGFRNVELKIGEGGVGMTMASGLAAPLVHGVYAETAA